MSTRRRIKGAGAREAHLWARRKRGIWYGEKRDGRCVCCCCWSSAGVERSVDAMDWSWREGEPGRGEVGKADRKQRGWREANYRRSRGRKGGNRGGQVRFESKSPTGLVCDDGGRTVTVTRHGLAGGGQWTLDRGVGTVRRAPSAMAAAVKKLTSRSPSQRVGSISSMCVAWAVDGACTEPWSKHPDGVRHRIKCTE
jgi:hypothetical protein